MGEPGLLVGLGASPGEAGTLRFAAARTDRLIGVALQAARLGDPAYGEIARREFNYVTAENEMKWDALEPAPGVFDFSAADRIVAFAEANDMRVKGHTLVWHSQLPAWLTQLNTADAVRTAMVNHVATVAEHYRGRVVAWDVVNEAWENGRALRASVFQTYLGETFIDEAFHAARAADPEARLYYNDFGGEGMGRKATAIYDMVVRLLERQVPIDGVGLQMHTQSQGGPSVQDFNANLQRLANLGLDVIISEMDVRSCLMGDVPMDQQLAMQRDRYFELVNACVTQPACTEVSVWGISDQLSWLNNQDGCEAGELPLPLLFDDAFSKKPAFEGVLSALEAAR